MAHGYDIEFERFLIPPMDGLLRRLFGARWGIILISAPEHVSLDPIISFLADYSLKLDHYSAVSAEAGDFDKLEKEPTCIKTIDEILNEAKTALPVEEISDESGECGVRHVPRNPEFVFVGDLKPETVIDVVQSSLSRKLVVAGIKAEGSFPALRLFRTMVGSDHLVAASLMGIIGLNTVSKICPECRQKVEYNVSDQDAFLLGARESKLRGYRGLGCESCNLTGSCGLMLIHEGFEMSERLRTGILTHIPLRRLRLNAKNEGMTTLLDQAWLLAEAGEITLEEVVRIAEITDPGSELE